MGTQQEKIYPSISYIHNCIHGMSTVTKMTSGHIKVKKGTGHVFYMATPSDATESVCQSFSGEN